MKGPPTSGEYSKNPDFVKSMLIVFRSLFCGICFPLWKSEPSGPLMNWTLRRGPAHERRCPLRGVSLPTVDPHTSNRQSSRPRRRPKVLSQTKKN
jgi:hypothetical protein